MARTTVTPEVESKWYVALYEEDCKEVMQLLTRYEDLLVVGWENSDREVEGYGRFWMPWKKSKWKGRTALHVGARRGCVDLVKQILRICNFEYIIDDLLSMQEHGEEVTEEGECTESTGDQSDLATNEESERKREIDSSFSHADAHQVTDVLGRGTSSSTNGGQIRTLASQIQSNLAENRNNGARSSGPNVASERDRLTNLAQAKVALWQEQMSADRRAFARWKQFKRQDNNVHESVLNPKRGKGKLSRVAGFRKDRYGNSGRNSSFLLERLILTKDGEYKLDANAIAALHGNHDIVILLSLAMVECENSPYQTNRKAISLYARNTISIEKTRPTDLSDLRRATEEVFGQDFPNDPSSVQYFVNCYNNNPDFNFLPREVFLFHFLFTDVFDKMMDYHLARSLREALWRNIRESPNPKLWCFVLELRDGQGRTPLHVAVDESTVWDFCNVLECDETNKDGEAIVFAMEARDGAGRTALHRAVARGQRHTLDAFLELGEQNPKTLKTHAPSIPRSFPFSADQLSEGNGFEGLRTLPLKSISFGIPSTIASTPLETAIILKTTRIFEDLAQWLPPHRCDTHFHWVWKGGEEEELPPNVVIKLDIMELATLLEDRRVVRHLLKDGYQKLSGEYAEEEDKFFKFWNHPWPALHLAATVGRYEVLKMFLDDRLCDPFVEDFEGNSALHHALKVRTIEFKTHLLDYVDCRHVLSSDGRKLYREVTSERQSCINLLLRSGCDIFKVNKKMETPYPQGHLSSREGFHSWWNDKQEKEFGAIQNTLNIAANAITVTATLVATTSFIGPLQPPLGYADYHIQDGNVWVRVFIVCDTVSFYLAIAAITFSLIPSLPILQQGMVDELRRTRRMVTLSVGTLFPSVICVLVAFGSSSIAAASYNGTISIGQKLSIAGIFIGGPFFLTGFFLLFIRLLAICFPSKFWIRHIYNATSF